MVRLKYIFSLFALVLVFAGSVFAEQLNLPWIDVVTRQQWWADESIRLKAYKTYQQKEEENLEWLAKLEQMKAENTKEYQQYVKDQYEYETANNYMKENYGNEISVDDVNYYYWIESTGTMLSRPESFKFQKIKFIVHHTADSIKSDPLWQEVAEKAEMKRIYRYHALTQTWGDLWYNFVIGPSWKIYEWRAGGIWVVWAHAKWNNVPSVWVALMWNFNNTKPTQKQVDSLVTLLTQLARKYNIDPYSKVNYHKEINQFPFMKTMQNYTIVWHKDAWSTACPWTNLYNKLPDIRNKVKANLSKIELLNSSNATLVISWIKYLDQGISALVLENLPINSVKYCTSKDPNVKINSCAYNNSSLTMQLAKWTWFISGIKEFYVFDNDWNKKTISVLLLWQSDLDPMMQKLKKNYRAWLWNTGFFNKITDKIDINQVKTLLSQNVNVLLSEASNLSWYVISCVNTCVFEIHNTSITSWSWVVLKKDGKFSLYVAWKTITSESIRVSWNWWLVQILNYTRKSYAWVARNIFHWSLFFAKDIVVENWKTFTKQVVINSLAFEDYMKWIVETNDTETIEKNRLMALIAKNYVLFYMNKKNIHPSLPAKANYTAIDNPDLFQKYVWAWLEKTLKKRYKALDLTKNQIVMYKSYLPILPYFNCSAWFTWSAKEKFGRQDTPYLTSRADVSKCTTFKWHGVWLSGKWAQWWSQLWRNYSQIIKYYYQWVEIVDF